MPARSPSGPDEPTNEPLSSPGREHAQSVPPEADDRAERDWSTSAARWPILIVLATASVVGLYWAAQTRLPPPPVPVVVAAESREAAEPTEPGGTPSLARGGPVRERPYEPPVVPDPALSGAPEASPEVRIAREPTPDRGDASSIARQIDLNAAPPEELELLPGIGPTLAARIVEERDAEGLFRSVDDLQRVRGIGPRTVERLRAHATVEP
ncbi:MAG: ComEA family DNA-binding protein [Phycisphaerales bacterium]|nr:MAG: ComEA family DNA-binding protein [Phycisphaerales bacterium]